MTTTDTPRTDDRSSDHIGFWSCATVPSSFARQLERELSHSLANQLKTQAEVNEIRATLGDDGRRTHKEVLELATKASEWRTWKEKYIDLKNAHIAEGQDPAGTIWEHADKLQKELKASKAEVEFWKAKAYEAEAKLEAEVERLNHQLLKTESDLLQSQDINSWIDSEYRIACKRAEKAEAEVARLQTLPESRHKAFLELLDRTLEAQSEIAKLRGQIEQIKSEIK